MEFLRRAQPGGLYWYYWKCTSVSLNFLLSPFCDATATRITSAEDMADTLNYQSFLLRDYLLSIFRLYDKKLISFSFRIFQIPKLGMKLKQDVIPLSYTPRKFISHPTNRFLYLVEGDHRVLSEEAIGKGLAQLVHAIVSKRVQSTDGAFLETSWQTY